MKKLLPLLLSLIFLTGCIQLDAPKVTYIDSKVTRVTLEGAQVDFLFDVENKNPIPLEVSGYSYKISINGRQLLSETRKGFGIGSNEKKRISIPLFVRYDRVFDSVLGIAANIIAGKMYFDYNVEGSLSAGSSGLTVTAPIHASGRVKIPKEYLKI